MALQDFTGDIRLISQKDLSSTLTTEQLLQSSREGTPLDLNKNYLTGWALYTLKGKEGTIHILPLNAFERDPQLEDYLIRVIRNKPLLVDAKRTEKAIQSSLFTISSGEDNTYLDFPRLPSSEEKGYWVKQLARDLMRQALTGSADKVVFKRYFRLFGKNNNLLDNLIELKGNGMKTVGISPVLDSRLNLPLSSYPDNSLLRPIGIYLDGRTRGAKIDLGRYMPFSTYTVRMKTPTPS